MTPADLLRIADAARHEATRDGCTCAAVIALTPMAILVGHQPDCVLRALLAAAPWN